MTGWEETDFDLRGRVIEQRQGVFDPQVDPPAGEQFSGPWLRSRRRYDVMDRPAIDFTQEGTSAEGIPSFSKVHTAYDGLGRRSKITDHLGNWVSLDRNLLGQAVQRIEHEAAGDGSLPDRVLEFVYDELGRAREIRLPEAQENAPLRRVVRRYDARGLVTQEWSPLGVPASGAEPTGEAYKTEYRYDGFGRRIQQRRHTGASAWSDGWQEVDYAWDAGGRLIQITADRDQGLEEVT